MMTASGPLRMPPEWHPHDRCWMSWPCFDDLWPDTEAARTAYLAVAEAIARFEPLTFLVTPQHAADLRSRVSNRNCVLEMPLDDSWLRDNGPTFAFDAAGQKTLIDWQFNAWGDTYGAYADDNAVPSRLAEHLDLPRRTVSAIVEGGGIHVDGEGTLFTTPSVLLNANRNPGMNREDFEALFADVLGIERVLWLPHGLVDDETDGHVDNVMTVVAPGRVLLSVAGSADDPNGPLMQENAAYLRGQGIEVIELPLGERERRHHRRGDRLGPSYVNLYIANGGVVMPSFDDPSDARALAIVRDAFADRKVVQVDAQRIIEGGGGIHCITQQEPSAAG